MANANQAALLDAPPKTQAKKADAPAQKSLRQLVLDFYRMLEGHPEVNMLAAGMEERPNSAIAFQDITREEQRVVTMRFVMKWPKGGK